jgi:ribosomal protein S4E
MNILSLKEGANILVIEGKHSGIRGKIKKINPELKMIETEKDKEKINVLIKQIMVIE